MTTKMKTPYFYGLSHMKGQFMVSAIFLIDNFFLVSLEINDRHLTSKIRRFLCIYCYYKYTA